MRCVSRVRRAEQPRAASPPLRWAGSKRRASVALVSPRSRFGFVISAGLRATRGVDLLALLSVFQRVELTLDPINFFVRAVLEIDEVIAGLLHAAQQFIELKVKRPCIAVLRVLNQEHHQKRDDRRARIDDELPSVRIAEDWAGQSPQY